MPSGPASVHSRMSHLFWPAGHAADLWNPSVPGRICPHPVERRSARQFRMNEATLYPALHAMERAGFLKAEWRVGENGGSREYYALTANGRRQAVSKWCQWDAISAAMRSILGEAHR